MGGLLAYIPGESKVILDLALARAGTPNRMAWHPLLEGQL